MDSIWSREGMDFRMMPYNSLATASQLKFLYYLTLIRIQICLQVGMIKVFRNTVTVHQIQKRALMVTACSSTSDSETTTCNKPTKNNRDKLAQAAIETFTKSCASYCEATHILGIHRHPNNIIVTENGQIFGQFLGHYKKKFRINKERVMSVLPHDFIYAISSKIKTS